MPLPRSWRDSALFSRHIVLTRETDCAVCAKGYAGGTGNTCHSCKDKNLRAFIPAGAIFLLVMLVLLFMGVVFLVGGLDALENVRRSVARGLSFSSKNPSSSHPVRETRRPERRPSAADSSGDSVGCTTACASASVSEAGMGSDQEEPTVSTRGTVSITGGASASDVGECGETACCRLGGRLKHWASRLPLDKLKILVVVWQILTVFPSITRVDFPLSYSWFLDLIDVVNLDLGQILSAACVLPALDFYERLLVTTLTPLGLMMLLVLTFQLAKRRAGSTNLDATRLVWSRHMTAGLLVTFLVSLKCQNSERLVTLCDTSILWSILFSSLHSMFTIPATAGKSKTFVLPCNG